MRSPTTATLESPPPRPLAFHASGGPAAGHSPSRPVSADCPSRLGPRQPGQSEARRSRAAVSVAAAIRAGMDVVRVISDSLAAPRPMLRQPGPAGARGKRGTRGAETTIHKQRLDAARDGRLNRFRMKRSLLVLAFTVLYFLHQDVWFWGTARPLVFGFVPIGLFYHACFSVAAALF